MLVMVLLNPERELKRLEVEEARQHLIPYVQGNVPGYQPGWVHQELSAELEQFSRDVVARKSPRLMIFMPPRAGKSEMASQNFPAWHLGRNPDHNIMLTSYNSAKGEEYSEKALDYAKSEWHREVYPKWEFKSRHSKRADWKTAAGGRMMGSGVGGSLTGRGAHIAILDDLIKNWEEALSKTMRQKAWDFYTSTVRTRLAPGGGIIFIMTRWHVDDVGGRLIQQMAENPAARQWRIFKYKAIADQDEPRRKKGEALHPERYSSAELREIEQDVGPRVWISLYQQEPRPDGGQYIKASWFKRIEPADVPRKLRWVRFWDLAVQARESSNHTASFQVAVERKIPEGGTRPVPYLYIRGGHRWKKNWPESKTSIGLIAETEKVAVGIEANSAFDIAAQEIREAVKGKAHIQAITVSSDKLSRAVGWLDIAEAGRCYLVDDGSWISPFLAEAEAWDPLQRDQEDDQIDAVSGGYGMAGSGGYNIFSMNKE